MVTHNKRLLAGLLLWYVVLSLWTAYEPADRQFWMLASILPGLLVLVLVGTHRYLPLSPASYVLITMFLSLHTIGVHYTYAQVPAGTWLEYAVPLGRNQYDRIVHFCFGFLLAYPIEELFRLTVPLRGWLLYYLPVMTVLGLSGLWEIMNAADVALYEAKRSGRDKVVRWRMPESNSAAAGDVQTDVVSDLV